LSHSPFRPVFFVLHPRSDLLNNGYICAVHAQGE
jgi:hypothetical protein